MENSTLERFSTVRFHFVYGRIFKVEVYDENEVRRFLSTESSSDWDYRRLEAFDLIIDWQKNNYPHIIHRYTQNEFETFTFYLQTEEQNNKLSDEWFVYWVGAE